MTVVVNLFGGSGCGKSTTAALLFARMKLNGLHVELVREYVKQWAWTDRKVGEWDQLYLLGKQSAYESTLYGKVDYIITDSPFLLAGIYQNYYSGGQNKYVSQAAEAFMNHAQEQGVVYKNFFLRRNKQFDPRGRWETEDKAKEIDSVVYTYLERLQGNPPVVICGPNEKRDFEILDHLGILGITLSGKPENL